MSDLRMMTASGNSSRTASSPNHCNNKQQYISQQHTLPVHPTTATTNNNTSVTNTHCLFTQPLQQQATTHQSTTHTACSPNHCNNIQQHISQQQHTHTHFFYRSQTKLRKGNVFTPVCQSFCSQGGVCPSAILGYTPPSRHPPGQTSPPTDGYCCGRYASYWNAFFLVEGFFTLV